MNDNRIIKAENVIKAIEKHSSLPQMRLGRYKNRQGDLLSQLQRLQLLSIKVTEG